MDRRQRCCLMLRLSLFALLLLSPALSGLRTARAAEPDAEVLRRLRAQIDRHLSPEQRAELRFLENLGWRLSVDPRVQQVTVLGGQPCKRPDIRSAQAAGDLRIVLPQNLNARTFSNLGAQLATIADSTASRCAYQHRVAVAVDRATSKLAANTERDYYVFPKILFVLSPFFQLAPPESEWVREGKIWRPRTSAARAIEAFYTQEAAAECFAAQMLAMYAWQYELYGAQWFDQAFTRNDITLGWPHFLWDTPFGQFSRPEQTARYRALLVDEKSHLGDPGKTLAGFGPLAFVGLTGIVIDHATGEHVSENITFVRVSPRACEGLRQHGFAFITSKTKEALDLLESAKLPLATREVIEDRERGVKEILDHPILSEVMIYCHPFGVISLAEMIENKLRNTVQPTRVLPYVTGREDYIYERYRSAFKARRMRSPAPPRPQ